MVCYDSVSTSQEFDQSTFPPKYLYFVGQLFMILKASEEIVLII